MCTQLRTPALFRIAQNWKEHKCPSMGEWVNRLWNTHTTAYDWFVLQKWRTPTKAARHKRVHTSWFHLYVVPEQGKLEWWQKSEAWWSLEMVQERALFYQGHEETGGWRTAVYLACICLKSFFSMYIILQFKKNEVTIVTILWVLCELSFYTHTHAYNSVIN